MMNWAPPSAISPEQEPEAHKFTNGKFFVKFWAGIFAFAAVAAVFGYCAPKAGAEELPKLAVKAEQGRPDPTGQGRYFWIGPETSIAEARVVKKLPAGASDCAHAGELIGVPLWNSTREGKAILSRLTEKATISVAPNGEFFLCKCAGGYNQLFSMAEPQPPTAPVVPPAPTPAVQPPAPPAPPQVAQAQQNQVIQTGSQASGCDPELVHKMLELAQKNGRKNNMSITCGGMEFRRDQFKPAKPAGQGFWSSFWNAPMGVPIYGNMGGGVYGGYPAQNYTYSTIQPIRPYVAGGVLPPCGGGCGNPAVRGGAN